ncbi:MAG: TIGR02281 family clan AA aspartic protease [Rhizobiaceae bacterium]
MGRFFWIIIGLIGLLLITLIASGDTGKAFGFETGQFAAFSVMALWAVVIGSGVFTRGMKLGDTLKQIVIWVVIILGLMTGYVFRYDIQDFGSRLSGGLIPGSPITSKGANGGIEVTLIRSENGHFEASVGVNDKSVRFLIDTGATAIVLTAEDAALVGIDAKNLAFTIPTSTANGTAYSAEAKIKKLYLGGIERNNLKVLVSQSGRLNQSLLGQQFLESLSSYEKRGDRLTLRD